MHTMLKRPVVLAALLAALFVTSFVPGFAEDKANTPPSVSLEEVKSKTFNLQGHEKRINAYHDKMSKDGKSETLSKEFVAVHHGMKKGNYTYDLATTRKVMREVYASRVPAASKGFKQHIETKAKK